MHEVRDLKTLPDFTEGGVCRELANGDVRGGPPARTRGSRWLGVACAALAAITVAGCGEAGLSESSTCKEFLAADPADQQSITQQLAGKFGKADYATPLGMPAVPYYCARNANTTLQEFFEAAG